MVQAMRQYAKGSQSLNAMVMVGNSMMAQGQAQPQSIDSTDGMMKTETIDGFQVIRQHAKKEVEGAVIVSLSSADEKGAQFILHYTGLKPDEALALAKQFNWKQLQKTTAKMK